ncbi:MAG TPA: ABC-2 family transporter protein [Candidatus Limnocylindria bacterium]|nr:ABC-2 family transporter protein [Candidatus Limnocylindria bacterium]
MNTLRVYAKLAGITSHLAYVYRFNLVLQLVGLLLQIFLLRVVWTAIYADRAAVDGIDLVALLTYLTVANLQIYLIYPEGGELLQQRIREGKVALDLARPVGLIEQLVAQHVGYTLGFLPFVLATIPVAFFVGVLRPPASVEAALLYLAGLVIAYVVILLIGLLLGMIAFWTLETGGLWAIYRFTNLFFAGALVPIWLFPEPLRTVAELLPFQTQANIPVSIYIGRIAGADAIRGLIVGVVWVVVLAIVVRLVWAGALRRVVIQGG